MILRYLSKIISLQLIFLIKIYQILLSPILKTNCRYMPTCSEYSIIALKEYGVPNKYIRIIKRIYETATIQVRLQEPSGEKCYSRSIPIRRGALQGDIPSPVFFIVSLDKLLKDHGGGTNVGIKVTDNMILRDLEFADDAALPDENTVVANFAL